jgi:hypothetical protein
MRWMKKKHGAIKSDIGCGASNNNNKLKDHVLLVDLPNNSIDSILAGVIISI